MKQIAYSRNQTTVVFLDLNALLTGLMLFFSALEIPGRTFPVEQIFLEDCLDITGITFKFF